jgi:hypothetical protein
MYDDGEAGDPLGIRQQAFKAAGEAGGVHLRPG